MTAFMDRLLIKNLVFVNPFVKKCHLKFKSGQFLADLKFKSGHLIPL